MNAAFEAAGVGHEQSGDGYEHPIGRRLDEEDLPPAQSEADRARGSLAQAREEAELAEDSFFTDAPFHATVVIEEPEAHLHPQLQHGLVRHLRRTALGRPELQIILSSHAPDVASSARPEDIVVLRRLDDGCRVTRSVAQIPFTQAEEVLRKARLHLDAARSSSLFAERLALVEGVTETAVIRELAWAWAGADPDKQAFVDALTIVPMGTRVGPWPVRPLATRGYELCRRLAVLSDSDNDLDQTPTEPSWLAAHDRDVVRIFFSHPTLEPAVTPGNEGLVRAALDAIDVEPPTPLTSEAVRDLFRSARKPSAERPALSAGSATRRKGEFALAFAEQILLAREAGETITVPPHLASLLEFLYPKPPAPSVQNQDGVSAEETGLASSDGTSATPATLGGL